MKSKFFILKTIVLQSNSYLLRSIGVYHPPQGIHDKPFFRITRDRIRNHFEGGYCNFELKKGTNLLVKEKL